jgi:hypothetical protein
LPDTWPSGNYYFAAKAFVHGAKCPNDATACYEYEYIYYDLESPYSNEAVWAKGPSQSISPASGGRFGLSYVGGSPMAIERIGSLTQIEVNIGSIPFGYSGTITVPSDAEIIIVGIVGYNSAAGNIATSGSIGGAALTKIAGDGSTSYFQGSLFYKVSPATGSQTLALTCTSSGDGAKIVYGFYKGIDTASAVRDTDGVQAGSPGSYDTKTLTASSGDMIVGWVFGYTGSASVGSPTFQNISEVTTYGTTYRSAVGSWAEGSPSGNTSVGVSAWTDVADGGICAVVLKPSAVTATSEQEGYRFINDDGSESAASFAADQDTGLTAPAGVNKRIRFLINTTGDVSSTQFQLEYKKSTSSTWIKVVN